MDRLCEQIKKHLRDQGIKPIEDARIVFRNGSFMEFIVRYNPGGTDFHVEPVGCGTIQTIILEAQDNSIRVVQSGRMEGLCTTV
ncbi:MAG: hypothetical protein QG589_439 [Patescibacteria group bacterium]|jgi:hypothetical protein|nr:hypothetical protein [Patescibacteria group bacterium]